MRLFVRLNSSLLSLLSSVSLLSIISSSSLSLIPFIGIIQAPLDGYAVFFLLTSFSTSSPGRMRNLRDKGHCPDGQGVGSLRRYSLDLNNEMIYHSSKVRLVPILPMVIFFSFAQSFETTPVYVVQMT